MKMKFGGKYVDYILNKKLLDLKKILSSKLRGIQFEFNEEIYESNQEDKKKKKIKCQNL